MVPVNAIDDAASLLGTGIPDPNGFITFRTGARTRAVLATAPGVVHCFASEAPQVVAKLPPAAE